MLRIKAFPCRDSGYKIESESFKLSHISGTQPYKGVP